ncbi:MAG: hypothetical protein Kow00114_25110 [Kiloniellaceae bacterium]
MAGQRVTMKGLSKEAGIPYGTLQGYLLERHPMPAEALGKIAEILDVSADWLISGKPARLNTHCAGMALLQLEEMRSSAGKVGHEIAIISAGQLFADFYAQEYRRTHNAGAPADPANTSPAQGQRRS